MSRKKRKSSRKNHAKGQTAELTPAQAYARWESMHAPRTRLPSTIEAIQQSTWVYSAITFIAETLAQTALTAFRGKEPLETHPIFSFINRPNAYTDQNTSAKFRYAYMFELLLHGAVMRLFGEMQGFRPLTMGVRPRWHFRAQDGYDAMGRRVVLRWNLTQNATYKTFRPDDQIFHDTLYNPLHDYEGLPPLIAAMLSVANDHDISEFVHRYFENDGSTGVIFSTDHPAFTQTNAEEAAKAWREHHSGMDSAFKAKFVGFGLKPFMLGSALDAKSLQVVRTFTREEIISGIYKIPLDAISAKDGGGDIVIGGPSGGTQASAREAFLINCAMPWARRYDEEFNADVTWRFDAGIEVRHDFSSNPILERRRLERAAAAVQLIDRGVPLNEIIRWLKLDISPQPHGDDWWVKNDHLPARVVMDAGNNAIKIAIPDPVAQQRQAIRSELADEALDLAKTVRFAEMVRSDPFARKAFNGNGLHLGAPAGDRPCHPAPPA